MIRYKKRSVKIEGFIISSSSARFAASTTSGHGIEGQAEDAVYKSNSRPLLKDLYIKEQPSIGMYLGGIMEHGLLDTIVVQNCVKHGFVIDDGSYAGRINKDDKPFEFTLDRCRATECGGNALLLGHGTEVQYPRLFILNQFEALSCAWDVSQRQSEYQIIDRCTQAIYNQVDIEDHFYNQTTTRLGNPRTALSSPAKGVDVVRDQSIFEQPYFSSLSECINVSSSSDGVRVEYPTVFAGTYTTKQTNAFVISPSAKDVTIRALANHFSNGADNLCQMQSTSSRYYIDGVMYKGQPQTTFDYKMALTPDGLGINSGTLTSTTNLVSVTGQGDTTDSLNKIRFTSSVDGSLGEKMTLIFGGASSYIITINDVSLPTSGNIRTKDGSAILMSDTTRSVVSFIYNGTHWVEV